jgi:hypothetical protein
MGKFLKISNMSTSVRFVTNNVAYINVSKNKAISVTGRGVL